MKQLPSIVLPESQDRRVIEAAKEIIAREVALPILIGDAAAIRDELGAGTGYDVVSPQVTDEILTAYQSLISAKIPDREALYTFLDSPVSVGAALVGMGKADAVVAGSVSTTATVLRSYLKLIGLEEGMTRASSVFVMERGEEVYLFADCAVNIEPSSEVLAETAYLAAQFALARNIPARIAFLSFSTNGSAQHESVEKIQCAVAITKERWPNLELDGELQVDAAIVESVAAMKAPESSLNGQATILIFPDLNSGNIAYKLTERLGKFKAIGPLLLGFKKPAHDLSRGCSVSDIVEVVEIAAEQVKNSASV